jgi:hypothetical protein
VKLSPQEKAKRTRKKRALERAREAKLRSARARYAALVRWGKIVPIARAVPPKVRKVRKVRVVRPVAPPPVVTVRKKKKKKPGPKKLVGVERLKRDLENEKRRRRRAEKKWKETKTRAKATQRTQMEFIRSQMATRFTDLSNLPERMKGETSKQYARRLVEKVRQESRYQADQAYGPIAFASRLSPREVYTLFMSPEVA